MNATYRGTHLNDMNTECVQKSDEYILAIFHMIIAHKFCVNSCLNVFYD